MPQCQYGSVGLPSQGIHHGFTGYVSGCRGRSQTCPLSRASNTGGSQTRSYRSSCYDSGISGNSATVSKSLGYFQSPLWGSCGAKGIIHCVKKLPRITSLRTDRHQLLPLFAPAPEFAGGAGGISLQLTDSKGLELAGALAGVTTGRFWNRLICPVTKDSALSTG